MKRGIAAPGKVTHYPGLALQLARPLAGRGLGGIMVQARTWMAACLLSLLAACGGSDPVVPPPAPTGVAATPGDGVVGVRWSATAGADGYTVYRSTSSGSGKAGTAVQVNATSLDQAGLTNGVTYYFVVTAVNAGGESPPSAEVAATPIPAFQPLTLSEAGTGGGTVTSAPAGIDCGATCAASFATGSTVTLTATPDATSNFAGWSGACTGTGACAPVMDGPRSVTATFTRITHEVTVVRAGTGGGAVTSSPAGIDCGATCAATFDAGSLVTLTATPDATSTFTGWSVASCPGTGSCTVSIDAARSVTANFSRITFDLDVTWSGLGFGTVTSSPTGINCDASCSAAFVSGQLVTLSAVPGATSDFVGWSGGGCSGTGTCTVTMDAAKSITVTFTRKSYALTLSSTGGGTITSSPAGISCGATCAASFNHGTVVTLTPTADPGATFAGWSGACTGTGACIVNMDAAKVVTARFVYPVSVSLSGSGGGQVASAPAGINCGSACSATFDGGTQVTLTATPDATSSFGGWTGVDSAAGNTATVNLNAARAVTAVFARNTFTLSVTRSGAGTGSVASSPVGISCGATCSATFNQGTAVTLVASPTGASTFTGWSGSGCTGTGTCVVTMDAARSVDANFGP